MTVELYTGSVNSKYSVKIVAHLLCCQYYKKLILLPILYFEFTVTKSNWLILISSINIKLLHGVSNIHF